MNHKFLFQRLKELALLASSDISAEDRKNYEKSKLIDYVIANFNDILPLIEQHLEAYYKVMVSHFDWFFYWLFGYLFEYYIISFIVYLVVFLDCLC